PDGGDSASTQPTSRAETILWERLQPRALDLAVCPKSSRLKPLPQGICTASLPSQLPEAIAMTTPLANLPAPPYYAVVFSSLRRGGDDDGYAAAADHMVELAREQPG